MPLVRQPDGKYAMWCGVSDAYTHVKLDEDEAIATVIAQHVHSAMREARRQIEYANENPERWMDFLETMTHVHGQQDVEETFARYYCADLLEGVPFSEWTPPEEA